METKNNAKPIQKYLSYHLTSLNSSQFEVFQSSIGFEVLQNA